MFLKVVVKAQSFTNIPKHFFVPGRPGLESSWLFLKQPFTVLTKIFINRMFSFKHCSAQPGRSFPENGAVHPRNTDWESNKTAPEYLF